LKKILHHISEIFQIALGVLLASIGLKAFLLPNGFLDGGVTGIAILVSEMTGLDISYLLIGISIPFLIIAWRTLSLRIVLKSIIAIVALAIIIHFENFSPITDDKLLISIFGGLFLGAGIGVTIKNGAVLDGSEVLGVYVNDRFGVSIGNVILIFNLILFSVTAVLLSVEVAMYSILTYIVTAKVIDFIMKGFEDFIGFTIISDQSDEIEKAILNTMGAGLTSYQGANGYGHRGKREDFKIIHTVINRIDQRKLINLVEDIDHKAFMIEFDVNKIHGGILRKYLKKQTKGNGK
jgi:uncharacterized membrane-anchored protein YitT (DUF2179 family)